MMTRTDRRQRGKYQQRRAKMMNHGREKREVRERKERRKFKKEPLVNIKCFLFFYLFLLQSSYNELLLITTHCGCVSKFLTFEIFDAVAFFVCW